MKTRWRDHTASRAITGARNATPIVVTSPAHGFRDGEKVTISGVAGNTAANGSWVVTDVTVDSFALVNSKGNGAYTVGGSASGPDDGSLQHALISFAASLPRRGSVTVDFVDDPAPCSAGNQSSCDGAALTQEQMLGFRSGQWGAAIETVANRIRHSASARDMVAAGAWRYWLRGPVVTQVIVEDRSPKLAYDWGYKDRRILVLKGAVEAAAATIEVADASEIAGLPMPQQIRIGSEEIQVCAVRGNTLSAGQSSCPNADGRGVNRTRAIAHRPAEAAQILSVANPDGWRERTIAFTLAALGAKDETTKIQTPELLTALQTPKKLQIGSEQVLVCRATSTELTFGSDPEHCPDSKGRGLNGSVRAAHAANTPVSSPDWPSLWSDAPNDRYKSLHPAFILTFYQNWPGVKLDYILEDTWIDKLQDQFYQLTLKSGAGLKDTRAEMAFDHRALTRWRKTFWDGEEPAAAVIDYNFAYLTYSKALPAFDLTKQVPAAAIETEVRRFNASDRGEINGNADWERTMPDAGGRGDIGLFPRWYVLYLYTFDPRLYEAMMGNAAVSAYIPVHFRESSVGTHFDRQQAVDAFGRVLSVDARPRAMTRVFNLSEPRDAIVPVGITSHLPRNDSGRLMDNWNIDEAHQPSMAYIPYLITGDWYFLEELYFWASYNLAFATSGDCDYCRHDDWGFISESAAETRGLAWALRNVAHAAWFAPDGSPEKSYFLEKLDNNIAIREGVMNLTNGAFYDPGPRSKWSWGRHVVAADKPDPLVWAIRNQGTSADNPQQVGGCYEDSAWMHNFVHVVWGHIEELGFPQIAPSRRLAAINLLHQILDPAYIPKDLIASYWLPTREASSPCDASKPFGSWAAARAAVPALEIADSQKRWAAGAFDAEHGYPTIAFAAASFLVGINDGELKGEDAWNWMKANLKNQKALNENPKWAIVPRGQ